MPAIPVSDYIKTARPDLFDKLDLPRDSGESVGHRRARARDRDAHWREGMAKAYSYTRSRARDGQEAEAVDKAYAEALEEGADFTRYRKGSQFMAAPKISMDRNALARLRVKLHAIYRGSWATKEKGKHCGVVQRTTLAVFDALYGLALKHGQVFPSLEGLAYLAKCSKNTVIAALKELQEFGFVAVHRRLKRVKTALGFRTVQDTNAYSLTEPNGWGAMALKLFGGLIFAARAVSESNKWAARTKDSFSSRREGEKFSPQWPRECPWEGLREQWEAF